MIKSHLTSFGVPGIGTVPYGIHMCHFYPSRQDMIDGLFPYFLAGLAHNERCLWIAAPPLPADEIRIEAAKVGELKRGIESGQLEIFDAAEWYGKPAAMIPEKAIGRWAEAEERALADGFQGLRITGNTSFVPRENWSGLMAYEEKLHSWLKDRRIVTCCSYHRDVCRPVDMLEVVRRHDGTLDRRDEYWQVFVRSPKADAPSSWAARSASD